MTALIGRRGQTGSIHEDECGVEEQAQIVRQMRDGDGWMDGWMDGGMEEKKGGGGGGGGEKVVWKQFSMRGGGGNKPIKDAAAPTTKAGRALLLNDVSQFPTFFFGFSCSRVEKKVMFFFSSNSTGKAFHFFPTWP